MMDMRQITPGSAIDEFHFEMWAGFLRFMLDKEEVRAEFETETGETLPRLPKNGLEIAIDKACGYDREAAQIVYMGKFAAWVTPLYFGGPEDISPSIAAKLAEAYDDGFDDGRDSALRPIEAAKPMRRAAAQAKARAGCPKGRPND